MGQNNLTKMDFTKGSGLKISAVTFKNGQNFIGEQDGTLNDPQMIIIRDETELAAFNKMASGFAGDWMENISELVNLDRFPIYIVEMDIITCGIRYGEWRVFYDKDKLQEFINY
ncbi:MAG: hypothetical protein ABIJ59_14475 [Pseudomonadota bacterium]